MRIYLPATLTDVDHLVTQGMVEIPAGHASTRRLIAEIRQADPQAGEEEIAEAAQLDAAYSSLLRLADDRDAPRRRVILVADHDEVHMADGPDASSVTISGPVSRERVVCAFVDERDAEPIVAAVLGGDDNAVDALAESHLLWFDTSELDRLLVGIPPTA